MRRVLAICVLSLVGCASRPHCKPKCTDGYVCKWKWEETSSAFSLSTVHGPAECKPVPKEN